jgi:hypothetical protein
MVDISVLSNDVLMIIFSFVGYGAADRESSCPAARIAGVSHRWYEIYRQMKKGHQFVTYPLKRLFDWTIRLDVRTSQEWYGADGDIQSVVDPASRQTLPRWHDRYPDEPAWWTSADGDFAGRTWRPLPLQSRKGPFSCVDPDSPPTLEVCFAVPTRVRAIAIAARNVPRLVRVGADDNGSLSAFKIRFRPCQMPLEVPIETEEYMDLVATYLPQGRVASPVVLQQIPSLPTAFYKPLLCREKLRIHLLQSHEARWVGINLLAIFGEAVEPSKN